MRALHPGHCFLSSFDGALHTGPAQHLPLVGKEDFCHTNSEGDAAIEVQL